MNAKRIDRLPSLLGARRSSAPGQFCARSSWLGRACPRHAGPAPPGRPGKRRGPLDGGPEAEGTIEAADVARSTARADVPAVRRHIVSESQIEPAKTASLSSTSSAVSSPSRRRLGRLGGHARPATSQRHRRRRPLVFVSHPLLQRRARSQAAPLNRPPAADRAALPPRTGPVRAGRLGLAARPTSVITKRPGRLRGTACPVLSRSISGRDTVLRCGIVAQTSVARARIARQSARQRRDPAQAALAPMTLKCLAMSAGVALPASAEFHGCARGAGFGARPPAGRGQVRPRGDVACSTEGPAGASKGSRSPSRRLHEPAFSLGIDPR